MQIRIKQKGTKEMPFLYSVFPSVEFGISLLCFLCCLLFNLLVIAYFWLNRGESIFWLDQIL